MIDHTSLSEEARNAIAIANDSHAAIYYAGFAAGLAQAGSAAAAAPDAEVAALIAVLEKGPEWYCLKAASALAAQQRRIAELEQAQERAFGALAIEGVPKERARDVANGIGVLAQRWNKYQHAAESALAQAEAERAARR